MLHARRRISITNRALSCRGSALAAPTRIVRLLLMMPRLARAPGGGDGDASPGGGGYALLGLGDIVLPSLLLATT